MLERPDDAEWTEVGRNATVTRDLALLEEESELLCVTVRCGDRRITMHPDPGFVAAGL